MYSLMIYTFSLVLCRIEYLHSLLRKQKLSQKRKWAVPLMLCIKNLKSVQQRQQVLVRCLILNLSSSAFFYPVLLHTQHTINILFSPFFYFLSLICLNSVETGFIVILFASVSVYSFFYHLKQFTLDAFLFCGKTKLIILHRWP